MTVSRLVDACYCFFGIGAAVGNALILVTICFRKELRQSKFTLILALVAADFLIGISFTTSAWLDLVQKNDTSAIPLQDDEAFALALAEEAEQATLPASGRFAWHTSKQSQWTHERCIAASFMIIVSGPFAEFVTFCLALDRLYATCFAVHHVRHASGFVKISISIALVLALCVGASSFVGVSSGEQLPVCDSTFAVNPTFLHFWRLIQLGVCLLTISSYITGACIASKKHKTTLMKSFVYLMQAGIGGDNLMKQKLAASDKQRQLNKTVTAIIVLYACTTTLANVILFVNNYLLVSFDEIIRLRISQLCGLLVVFNAFINAPIHMRKNKEIKASIAALFRQLRRRVRSVKSNAQVRIRPTLNGVALHASLAFCSTQLPGQRVPTVLSVTQMNVGQLAQSSQNGDRDEAAYGEQTQQSRFAEAAKPAAGSGCSSRSPSRVFYIV